MSKIVFFILLFTSVAFVKAEEMSALQIMEKSEDARRVKGVLAEVVIKTTEKGKSPKEKKFKWWRKLGEDGKRFKTLTRFYFPKSIEGQGILFLEKSQNHNEVFLYLPRFKRIRRVEGQSQSKSFMGSAFSYSDIVATHADEYSHKLIRKEACLENRTTCWVIESVPLTEEVRDRTGYGKVVQWIHPENYLPVKGEYYSEDQKVLVKKMTSKEIKEIDIKNQKWMAHFVQFSEVKKDRQTTLQFSNVKVSSQIQGSIFTQQNLKKEEL